MEAVMVAGLAAVLVGGYFSAIDLLNDLGVTRSGFTIKSPRRHTQQG